jgi:hypothetical protein
MKVVIFGSRGIEAVEALEEALAAWGGESEIT